MSSDLIEVEYPLALSRGRSLVVVVLGVALTAGIAFIAATNSKGLRIVGLVTLPVEGATIVYWAGTVACGLFVLPMILVSAWRATFLKQRVAFSRSAVWLPRTLWSEQLVEVPFAEIASVSVWSYYGERVATLALSARKFRIGQSWLPSPSAFEDVLARLEAGMQARVGHLEEPGDAANPPRE